MEHVPSSHPVRLEKHGYVEQAAGLDKYLRFMVKGQDEAVEAVVKVFNKFFIGMATPQRPIGNLLLLGPTGTGKTHLVESVVRYLFGSRRSLIKIDCAEYQHGHEIAKLVGSPPGFLGHSDTEPLITQKKLRWVTDPRREVFGYPVRRSREGTRKPVSPYPSHT
jgi:ATP-dependent Clp protease ATP-binding subunit ClpA